jgi:hypothetical protein
MAAVNPASRMSRTEMESALKVEPELSKVDSSRGLVRKSYLHSIKTAQLKTMHLDDHKRRETSGGVYIKW